MWIWGVSKKATGASSRDDIAELSPKHWVGPMHSSFRILLSIIMCPFITLTFSVYDNWEKEKKKKRLYTHYTGIFKSFNTVTDRLSA